jgi:hypothetical protein
MSDQAFDSAQLRDAIWGIGDTFSDPAQAAGQLEALAARLRSGGQYAGGPTGPGTVMVPEVTPRMAPEQPADLQQLAQRLPQLERAVYGADEATGRDLLEEFTAEVNASLDAAAGRDGSWSPGPLSPHDPGHVRPPSTNEELQQLDQRARAMWHDPASVDQADIMALVDSYNGAVDNARMTRERQFEEAQRHAVTAGRERRAQARAGQAGRR